MANRSYLYSIDTLPSAEHAPKPIRGIGEWPWDIPLAHRILASENPQRVQSQIWKSEEIAIVADFAPGVARLLALLDRLAVHPRLAGNADFADAVAETKEALTSDRAKGTYILLEAGEIYYLLNGPPFIECEMFRREIEDEREQVERALAGHEPEWLDKVAETWAEKLGLYWSDVLYFDPGNDDAQ